jgi:NAD/NADP transhydrogenase beta subunit
VSAVDPVASTTSATVASAEGAAGARRAVVTTETATLAVLAVVGGYMAFGSFELGLKTNDAWVAAGTMPLIVGSLLCLLALTLLVKAVREAPSVAEASTTEVDDDIDIFGRTAPQRVRQLWIVAVALGVTIGLVSLLGFAIAFGALVLFIATVVEKQRLPIAVMITVTALVAVHLIFVLFLNVPLPEGMLGIGF